MSFTASSTTSSASDGEPLPPSPLLLIPALPNDIALQCIARTPRLHHHSLSFVSKSWHHFLKTPLFFNTRSLLNCKENLLYINLHINNTFKWFVICQNSTNPNRVLCHVPQIPSEKTFGSAFVVLGAKIYAIGGSVNDIPSKNVWVFDCRFNKWETGPRMNVVREHAVAEVVGGRIYVMGGCSVDKTEWAEVFDPVIGQWETVTSPVRVRDKWVHGSVVIKGRVHSVTGSGLGGFTYDPKGMAWEDFPMELKSGWRGRAAVVEDVLYCFDYYVGKIRGFEGDVWKEVKGIDEITRKLLLFGIEMVGMGGRLVVVWKEKEIGDEMEVFCAEIDIRKDDDDGELWGSIVWSDVILLVPPRSAIAHALAVEL